MDRMKGILGEEMGPSYYPPDEGEADSNDNSNGNPSVAVAVSVDGGGACGGEVIDPDKTVVAENAENANTPQEEEETTQPQPEPDMHGFYSGMDLNELLQFAILINEPRNELEIVAELIPIKVREQLDGNGPSLSREQMTSLGLLFDRIINDEDLQNRIICLRIARDFLFAFQRQYVRIFNPQHRIRDYMDNITRNRLFANTEEDPKRVEQAVVMEISEWLERHLEIIRNPAECPYSPNNETVDAGELEPLTPEPDVIAEPLTPESDVIAEPLTPEPDVITEQ